MSEVPVAPQAPSQAPSQAPPEDKIIGLDKRTFYMVIGIIGAILLLFIIVAIVIYNRWNRGESNFTFTV